MMTISVDSVSALIADGSNNDKWLFTSECTQTISSMELKCFTNNVQRCGAAATYQPCALINRTTQQCMCTTYKNTLHFKISIHYWWAAVY